MKSAVYFSETRPQFLILSVVLVFLATAMSHYYASINWMYTLLCFSGLILLHTSVNVLNDYSDYVSGVDFRTHRTPFNGGSGLLTSGKISPETTLKIGLISFGLALPIGGYFLFARGWFLLPLFLTGAFLTLCYTEWIAKSGYGLPELAAGLGLGALPVFGMFIIMSPEFKFSALYASIPSGILVTNLLFLNEFPDTEADKIAQRKTLPILLGHRRASQIYAFLTVMVYVWIAVGAALNVLPFYTLTTFLTFPLALKAVKVALRHHHLPEILPALAANVQMVILTQLLLGMSFVLAG